MSAFNSDRALLAGVIGSPVNHSLSPLVHRYWLRNLGIKGYYIPIEVSRDNFSQVASALPMMGFSGVNITIPHKVSALTICDTLSDQAVLIGAVNTLTISEKGKINGDNTDAYGFLQSIIDAKPGWKASDQSVLVLGAGGAARAVVYSLISEGADEVHIVNRTRERAELLKRDYGSHLIIHSFNALESLIPKMGTIINTTSLGMVGKPKLLFPYDSLESNTVVLDLVYTPLETDLLREARIRECLAIDGLGMLLNQAAQSFYNWFKVMPIVDDGLRRTVLSK